MSGNTAEAQANRVKVTSLQAATEHVFSHRTYCNHLNAWIARADLEELGRITYGATLPEDLGLHMAEVVSAAGGKA